ncbi:MAG: hypothetical protein ACRCYP_05910 [Alphaproteobacteria bacterium]
MRKIEKWSELIDGCYYILFDDLNGECSIEKYVAGEYPNSFEKSLIYGEIEIPSEIKEKSELIQKQILEEKSSFSYIQKTALLEQLDDAYLQKEKLWTSVNTLKEKFTPLKRQYELGQEALLKLDKKIAILENYLSKL